MDYLREGTADLPIPDRVVEHVHLLRFHLDALVDNSAKETHRLLEELAAAMDEIIVRLSELCHVRC